MQRFVLGESDALPDWTHTDSATGKESYGVQVFDDPPLLPRLVRVRVRVVLEVVKLGEEADDGTRRDDDDC